MGCNYYLSQEPCDRCNRAPEGMHIGKSSAGWTFALCIHPEYGIRDWSDWLPFLQTAGTRIIDEEGRRIAFTDFVDVVTAREGSLERRSIDGSFCVGHGAGTWDLVRGEFY